VGGSQAFPIRYYSKSIPVWCRAASVIHHAELIRRLRAVPANTAALRAERKRISKEIAGLDRAAIFELAESLIDACIPRFVAYELILNHKAAMESIQEGEAQALGEGMAHWGDVDAFGCLIAGRAWRAGRIPDRVIRSWARSDDWCWRRAALVSTVPLNSRAQGGTGDSRRTLAICRILVTDRHDLVVKALSWALRELSKRDRQGVHDFLAAHAGYLAARVVREVNRKVETGRKNA
jgi:3-methyladenine DNA glycosylase AlkD